MITIGEAAYCVLVDLKQKIESRLIMEETYSKRLDFDQINQKALTVLPSLLYRWLPVGKCLGNEWIARNPKRNDQRAGSFRINMLTGKWADFATNDCGGDPISLAAYLAGVSQFEAAKNLDDMFGGQ